jgi:hypothetical protein
LQPPLLDPRHGLLAQLSCMTQIALAPTSSPPKRPDDTADTHPIHMAHSIVKAIAADFAPACRSLPRLHRPGEEVADPGSELVAHAAIHGEPLHV